MQPLAVKSVKRMAQAKQSSCFVLSKVAVADTAHQIFLDNLLISTAQRFVGRELFKLLFMCDRENEDLSPSDDFNASVENINYTPIKLQEIITTMGW